MKQETLEEAAEKYANDWEEIYPELDSEDITPIAVSKIDFIAGAKWQAETTYSYDELRKIAYNAYCLGQLEEPTEGKFNQWIAQFKK